MKINMINSINKYNQELKNLNYQIIIATNETQIFINLISAYIYKSWWQRIQYWLRLK